MDHEWMAQLTGQTPRAPDQLHPLALAYIGDTVFDLYVRTALIDGHGIKAGALHAMAKRRVCAAAQARAAEQVLPLLTEAECSVFNRARNAQPHTVPKNAQPGDYALATALEAVLGYLYLLGDEQSLRRVLSAVDNAQKSIEDKPRPRPYKG